MCVLTLPVIDSAGTYANADQLVFIFYEVSEPNLTNDYLAYHDNAIASTYQLYQEKKTGLLSTFPFGMYSFNTFSLH